MFGPSSWQTCGFHGKQPWSGCVLLHVAQSRLHFLHKRGHQMKTDTQIHLRLPSVWYESCLKPSNGATKRGPKVVQTLRPQLWTPSSLQSAFYWQPNQFTHDKKRFGEALCKYFLTWRPLVLGWTMVGHDLVLEITKTGKSLHCKGLFGNPKVHQHSK